VIRWRRRIAILAAYLIGLAGFFEASARLALTSDAFFRRVAGNDDASWRLRWAKRQRKQGRIYFEFDVHSPTRGWALKPGLQALPVFGGKRLSSNSRGVRGLREYAYERSAGAPRIVVLGDSFTFGEEVSDDETYAAQLEQMLPGAEVLNLGVHGYGHDQMLVYLQEEGVRYRPDVVLLGFLPDDMERNLLGFRDYAKPHFVLDGGALVLRNARVPAPEEMLAALPWRSRFADLLGMTWQGYRWRSGARAAEMRQLTLAILDAMAETIRASGARPAFAYLPVYGEITRADPGMTTRERFFFNYCREKGIPAIYLRPAFERRRKEGAELKTYGHWSPLEHRTAAEGIRDFLLENGLGTPAR
jgi:hypothetical protein